MAEPLVPLPASGRRHTTTRRVRLGDVNPKGRLRLDALARYLQDVASDDSMDSGLLDAMAWVVRRTVVEIHQAPVFREDLTLTTWCSGTGGRWAERRVTITGEQGGAVETAALWVHVDATTGRPKRLTEQFHALYGEAAVGREVRAKLSHPDPPPGASRHPWPARFTDFDVLGHVNNAVYWVAVEEELARRDLRAPVRAELEHRQALEVDHGADVIAVDEGDTLSVWIVEGDAVHASAVVVSR
jgi:acyl-ACP thioesterase